MVSMNSSQVQSPPWRQCQTAVARIREQITGEKIPFPESWNAAHRAERRHSCTTMASRFVRDAATLLWLIRRDRAFTSKWCELFCSSSIAGGILGIRASESTHCFGFLSSRLAFQALRKQAALIIRKQ